jgi:peptidylprolyl isomerase
VRATLTLALAALLASCGSPAQESGASATPRGAPGTLAPTSSPTPLPSVPPGATAVVELAKGGAFTIELRPDKAPRTVANFVAKARASFYDGLTFHRVVPGFVAQGGDPRGTGTGGGQQPTELSDLPFTRGAVGVARGGDVRVSNDAQFFVTLGDAPHLNGQYTNFGTVTAGMDAVDRIAIGDRIKTVRIERAGP